MTHNGFSGTLNPTQSINPAFTPQPHSVTAFWPVVISRPAGGRQQSRHQGPGLPGGPQIRGILVFYVLRVADRWWSLETVAFDRFKFRFRFIRIV